MPRIDPLQLLKCLSVLLTPDGGILSREEVPRLVNLMTKFSKKLVSKCVYVLILKNTETELVDMFMAEGGWALIQTWLQDAVQTSNWDLVREILGLLLVTPVDVERLKLNILPKLIKSLSRREELEGVAQLSTQLVQQWLTIVKGSSASQQAHIAAEKAENKEPSAEKESVKSEIHDAKEQRDGLQEDIPPEGINTNSFYKTIGKDGKLVIRRLSNETDKQEGVIAVESCDEAIKVDKVEEEKKEDKNRSSSSKSSRNNRSSSSNRDKDKDRHGRDKDRDKDRKKSSSSSSKHTSSNSSKSRSSSSSKDKKDRDKGRDTDKDKRNNGTLKTSSSSSSNKDKKDGKDKEKDKEKQAEKDKDTLAKIKPPTIDKLGRIPKKVVHTPPPDDKKDLKKKFSVGIRKDSEERPKTVKVFNSKMRSTGLEEEVKPAPPRSTKKPTPSVQLPTIPMKRPSPPKEQREPVVPPEKKLKIEKLDVPERPGAIKLIPPKPKPMLQESDLFMDALTAATTKKEPKKRKRRPSVSKDATASPTASPAREAPQTPTSPQTNAGSSPLGLKNIAPINFYQDTLSEEDGGNKEENKENSISENVEVNSTDVQELKEGSASPQEIPKTPTDENNEEEVAEPKRLRLDGELKGVLLYTKKKGPKKSISWRNESDLVEIRFFELDETERVNVTKTFGDMARMEMSSEREAIQLSRKTVGEDLMESQIMWRLPYELELEDPPAIPGFKSLEKDIQFAREKSVLQALYFDKRRIPESPEEPPLENHQMSDPVIIPLDDPDSQEIDLRSTPWPEPKGPTPLVEPQIPPQIFPNIPTQFTPQFNNLPPPAFQGLPPRYPVPGGPVGPPGNFGPPNMMPNGNMMGPPNMPPPNEMMNMNSNMFPPGGPMSDGFGPGPGPDFPMFNPNMANNMNMFPPKNFNNHRNNRGGGFRRGGGNNGGNWVRMSGGNNWKRGGGGHRGGRLCKNVQNRGFCRNRDNCPFVHP